MIIRRCGACRRGAGSDPVVGHRSAQGVIGHVTMHAIRGAGVVSARCCAPCAGSPYFVDVGVVLYMLVWQGTTGTDSMLLFIRENLTRAGAREARAVRGPVADFC